jgi:hypothetical protein
MSGQARKRIGGLARPAWPEPRLDLQALPQAWRLRLPRATLDPGSLAKYLAAWIPIAASRNLPIATKAM